MKVTVTLLDVRDGDAIIVELVREEHALVLVIDGGSQGYYTSVVKPRLQDILLVHSKIAPDIVVCTHYDRDHIGGLLPLLADYGADVAEVWVHPTPKLLGTYLQQLPSTSVGLLLAGQLPANSPLAPLLESYAPAYRAQVGVQVGLLLESLSQLKQLLALVPKNKIRPVFGPCQPLSDWPELLVLGPTRAYFEALFPPGKPLQEFVREEVPQELIVEGRKLITNWARFSYPNQPCEQLKTASTATLTATNKASIILAIEAAEGKYLFTGDAGIESFEQLPGYPEVLRDLYFLKVPHHASDNNISKELIDLMQPCYAYSSGDQYQDDAVLKCLESTNGVRWVRSTKLHGTLVFSPPAI
jgi:beta-lactamase superfamily II metal-dependent hydrolase